MAGASGSELVPCSARSFSASAEESPDKESGFGSMHNLCGKQCVVEPIRARWCWRSVEGAGWSGFGVQGISYSPDFSRSRSGNSGIAFEVHPQRLWRKKSVWLEMPRRKWRNGDWLRHFSGSGTAWEGDAHETVRPAHESLECTRAQRPQAFGGSSAVCLIPEG